MLQTSFQQSFAEQQSVLKTLSGSLTPLVSAGPNQQGFSSPELANLNTTAIDASGAGARNAEQALNNSLAGRGGGGSSGLESGVDQQLDASLASTATGQLAQQQNQIQAANYSTGRQNYFNAVSGANALAGQYNPTGFANSANTANSNAFNEADTIQQQQAQEDSEIAGGIASVAMDAATFGAGGIAGVGASAAGASQPGAFFSGGLNALSGGNS